MTSTCNDKTLVKLRSYSTVFSSTSFLKLLQNDDYSFLNSRIEKFDTSQIGKNVNTYYDYIQFIYNALGKQYKNEYVYKNTFINQLLIKNYGIKNTVAINEFRVGNSIADIVLFNGTSKAFEIKTELDSDKRLTGQLSDYNKIFKECYVVTHESLSEKYLNENRHIGIIEFIDSPKSPSMKEIREAKINKYIDSDTLIRAIRTQEYKNIIKQYYGNLPEMNSFNMFEICRKLMKKIPNKYLHYLFINELKKRKSNTCIIKKFNRELRQICLASNINLNSYNELVRKLNKRIKL